MYIHIYIYPTISDGRYRGISKNGGLPMQFSWEQKKGKTLKKHRESWGIPWHNHVYLIFVLTWKYLTITVIGHAGCFL